MNKISVITISFNCKDCIEYTLLSTIHQTYQNKEYIIIDGGSTDGTLEIIKKYKEHIDVIVSEKDNGIYDALNKGVQRASGDWIVCMNAGDFFANENVLSDIFKLSIPANIKIIYSDYWGVTQDGIKKHKSVDRSRGECLHQSSIYRKELHEKYGCYLVTKPYTVSDLLFFLSIPESNFLKVPYEISVNAFGGVSQNGLWCAEKALCLRVVFGYESLNSAFIKYWKLRFHNMIPYSWRRWIRRNILQGT